MSCFRRLVKNIATYLILAYAWLRKIAHRDVILLQGFVTHRGLLDISHANWGDDINKYFFEYVTKKKVVFLPGNDINPRRYICIGSILGMVNLENAIVFGGGVMHPNCEPVGRPYRIISVRGPRTREWLVNHGIECPETYGDPALLLPLFYQPVIHRGSAPLAIPHYKSLPKAMPMLDDITKRGFKLLDMGNYGTWTEIIDSICNSEFIISESLHGIIVAEAYGIPCIWVEFQEHFPDWTFKYNDFYEAIGRYEEEPIRVYKEANYENIIFDKLKQWKCANIDLEEMMKYFPFV